MKETKIQTIKIKDLIPDDRNFNRGTEEGGKMIRHSLDKFGAGRSILIDKDGRIIAGNKTVENAIDAGFDDVLVVNTDGRTLVAVQRDDVALDTALGREMALADNATSAANLDWDTDTIKEQADAWDYDPTEWGVDLDEEQPPADLDKEPTDKPYSIKITFNSEQELKRFVNKYEKPINDDFNVIMSVGGGEDVKLTLSTYKAIKYACEHFHYAHATPVNPLGYNVYNDAGEWCGVVLFGHGATVNIGKPYGLKQGEILELTRVALNGKQECTSQAVAMALKQLHKDCPLCRLVVSYADADQKHLGTIYQATNWIYEGLLNVGDKSAFIIHGRKVHRRSVGAKIINGRPCVQSLEAVRKYFDPNATEFVTEGKHKYCMPMDKAMRRQLAHLTKPYPKNDGEWTKIDRNIFKNRNNSTTDMQKRMETHLRGV